MVLGTFPGRLEFSPFSFGVFLVFCCPLNGCDLNSFSHCPKQTALNDAVGGIRLLPGCCNTQMTKAGKLHSNLFNSACLYGRGRLFDTGRCLTRVGAEDLVGELLGTAPWVVDNSSRAFDM